MRTYTVTVSEDGAKYLEQAARSFQCEPELVLRALYSVGSIHKAEAEKKLAELRDNQTKVPT